MSFSVIPSVSGSLQLWLNPRTRSRLVVWADVSPAVHASAASSNVIIPFMFLLVLSANRVFPVQIPNRLVEHETGPGMKWV